MSEKRTIILKEEDLRIPKSTTRKNREKPSGGIKVKSSQKKEKSTLKKRSILRMIREHQEDKYRKLYDGGSNKTTIENKMNESDTAKSYLSDFEQSADYLSKLSEEQKVKTNVQSTLKNYSNYNPTNQSMLFNNNTPDPPPISIDLNTVIPRVTEQNVEPPMNITQRQQPFSNPLYSSMKNGTMPTYRNWVKTQKNHPQMTFSSNNAINGTSVTNVNATMSGTSNSSNSNNISRGGTTNQIFQTPITQLSSQIEQTNHLQSAPNEMTYGGSKINEMIEMKKTAEKLDLLKKSNNKRKMKQKRISRRTFKLGKSKVFPRISVLVSNKTIRNNILTKTQSLKSVPIQDIKKFLIKKGFIKIGSTAPNDVLRKMYESVALICGEVNNHNPDNLFYNYLNGGL